MRSGLASFTPSWFGSRWMSPARVASRCSLPATLPSACLREAQKGDEPRVGERGLIGCFLVACSFRSCCALVTRIGLWVARGRSARGSEADGKLEFSRTTWEWSALPPLLRSCPSTAPSSKSFPRFGSFVSGPGFSHGFRHLALRTADRAAHVDQFTIDVSSRRVNLGVDGFTDPSLSDQLAEVPWLPRILPRWSKPREQRQGFWALVTVRRGHGHGRSARERSLRRIWTVDKASRFQPPMKSRQRHPLFEQSAISKGE
jgi:hypothetical protein